MKNLYSFICFALLFAGLSSSWAAETSAELKQIRQERSRLAAVRERLEMQLGSLGRELKAVDVAIVAARHSSRQAGEKAKESAAQLAHLLKRQHRLDDRVQALRRRMQNEVIAAYRRAGNQTYDLLALRHASVAEIPHRRFMLSRLLASQEEDRRAYAEGLVKLSRLQEAARRRRDELAQLHMQKVQAEKALAAKRRAKSGIWRRLKKDARQAKRRDRQLALQEAALRKLLAGLRTRLSAGDTAARWVSIRKLRGKLIWPVRGRLVASFGSRPSPDRPRLTGIRLAPPASARQVRSIAAGQVRYADWFGGYGLMMIVDHGDGLMSVYAHNNVFFKRLGDWVEAGEVVAEAGSTGWVKRVLLYFELRDGGKAVNPVSWLRNL